MSPEFEWLWDVQANQNMVNASSDRTPCLGCGRMLPASGACASCTDHLLRLSSRRRLIGRIAKVLR